MNVSNLLDKLSMLACSLHADGKFSEVNNALSLLMGYDGKELIGTHFTAYVSSKDLERSIQAWNDVKSGRPIYGFKNFFVTADGKLKCIEWNAVYNESEKKCYCTGRLITQKELDEHELNDTELYKKMFCDNPSAMFIYDPKLLVFVLVNKAACEQYGYSEEEFKEISVLDIIPLQRRENFLQKLPGYLQNKVSKLTDKHQSKSGKIIDVIAYAETITYKNNPCRLVTAIDITSKRENEERVQLLASVITNVTDGVMITEAEVVPQRGAKILYVNPAFENQTGFTADELINQFPDILGGTENNINSITRMLRAMEIGEPFIGELANHKKNGEKYWVSVNIAPVKDEKGKVINFIGVSRDITDYKKAQEEKQNLVNDLLKTNDTVKRFSYITSHDLRAPLTNIMAIVALIEKGNPNEEIRRLINLLKRSANQLNETIGDLVNIFLVKDTQVEKGLVDIKPIWNEVLEKKRGKLNAAGAIITEKFSENWIRFNKAYLSNVLQELLRNAIKFRRADEQLQIHISTERTPTGTRLIFTDNGTGVNHHVIKEKLFGLYQRFHTNVDGKGLGLFMMQSQIQAMNGTIKIESDINKGFKVYVEIPG